jgi:predicted site-specific integrase-resolvase
MAVFKNINGEYLISDNEILTKREMCEVLGISIATINRWMKKGMPYVQYSNQRNGYSVPEVNSWIEQTGRVPSDILKQWKQRKEGKKDD